MKNKLMTASAITLLLTACGGGGGGGGEAPAAPAETASAPQVAEPVTETITETVDIPVPSEAATTSELIVPAGYDLAQDYALTVNANAQSFSANAAHLSVCTDFSNVDGTYSVDFNSCLLKTNLVPAASATVAVPADVEQVIAVVLLLDTPSDPIYRIRQSTGEQTQFWTIQ